MERHGSALRASYSDTFTVPVAQMLSKLRPSWCGFALRGEDPHLPYRLVSLPDQTAAAEMRCPQRVSPVHPSTPGPVILIDV